VLRNPGFGGSVTSIPTGIDCGSSCISRFGLGTAVELSTQNAPGFRHSDWSGGGCSGNGACDLTLDGDTTVTAVWVARVTVNVDSNLSDSVSIDSSSAFKACSGDPLVTSCIVDDGDSVTVTAESSGFVGWSGDCPTSTMNPLTFTATAPGPLTCTAEFS
jgi:hypothetical protein